MNTIDRCADNNAYKKTKKQTHVLSSQASYGNLFNKDMSEYIIKQSVGKFLYVSILAFRNRKLL